MFAETNFDTTPYQDKYLVFWVVVWTEENGKLAPEIADHGLRAFSGTLKSLADIQTEQYSNNVGFYKLPFYVFAPPSSEAIAAAPMTQSEPGDVRLGQIFVSIGRGKPFEVTNSSRGGMN